MADRTFEITSMSLDEFNTKAAELYDGDDPSRFIEFVLTGIYDADSLEGQEPTRYQAAIDVLVDRVRNRDVATLQASRDYDSLIGVDKDIAISSGFLTVWPIPRYEDTLKTNLHFKYSFENILGEQEALLHQIPNLAIAKWGTHNLLRVLFLDLHGPERKSYKVTQKEQVDFYEKAVRPALKSILGARGGDLPPTHRAEMFRARGDHGHLRFSTRIIPEIAMHDFADCLRQHIRINSLEWAYNMVFLHQIRGVKNSTPHRDTYRDAESHLHAFLAQHGMVLDDIKDGTWYIDVGVEISSTLHASLAFRTERHSQLVQMVFEVPEATADRITEITSSKYYRDPASHLTGASGCRITPGARGEGIHEIKYFQAYLTDKSTTYAPNGRTSAKNITAAQLINGGGEKYITELYDTYRESAEHNFSTARLEVRVPILEAMNVLIGIDMEIIRSCLLSFERSTWSGFRAWRALGVKLANDWQYEGLPVYRWKDPALYLTAILAWFLNGLHATPDTGSSARELICVGLPRTRRDNVEKDALPFPISISDFIDDDDNDGDIEMGAPGSNIIHPDLTVDREDEDLPPASVSRGSDLVPHIPFGVVFLRELRRNSPVPRFYNKTSVGISDKSFKFLFGQSRENLILAIEGSGTSYPRHPDRLHNRTRQRLMDGPEPGEAVQFNLEEAGHELLPAPHDGGSDMSDDDDDEDDEVLPGGLDNEMQRMWSQFLRDIIKLCPNRRLARDKPYCLIPSHKLNATTIELYQTLNLSQIFDDVQWLVATKAEWRRTFDHLFPAKGVKKTGKLQNYTKTAYYPLWQMMTSRMSDDTAKKSLAQLWLLFKTMNWVPYALCDRIWSTRPTHTFKKSSGYDPTAPAPLVLVRGGTPIWDANPQPYYMDSD